MTSRPTTEIPRGDIARNCYDEDGKALISHTYILSVALGLIPNAAINNKFGKNSDIDIGSVPEDIWSGGGLYNFLSAPTTLFIASENTNDNALGSGARVLNLQLLDENYTTQSVNVTMNGQSSVTVSGGTYLRCNRMSIILAGSGEENAGEIDLGYGANSSGSLANRVGMIEAGINQTLQTFYTVPVGKTACVLGWGGSLNLAAGATNRDCQLSLRVRPFGETFQVKRWTSIVSDGQNPFDDGFNVALKITAKTDVVMRAESVSDDDTNISGNYDLLITDI